jgi:hypothetical protein
MGRLVDLEEHKRELEKDLFTNISILNSTLEKLDKVAKIAGKERNSFLNNLICSFHTYIIKDRKKEEKQLKEVKN